MGIFSFGSGDGNGFDFGVKGVVENKDWGNIVEVICKGIGVMLVVEFNSFGVNYIIRCVVGNC